jgi:PPOX class probable F420-dependent enzyme
VELTHALDFAAQQRRSVLTTIRRNGRPQLSNVGHYVYDGGLIRISITADRAKYHNLKREPWGALHVTQSDYWAYVVLEGSADLSPLAAQPDDPTVEELVDLYRDISGRDHPNWDEYRQAMVNERRVVVRFTPERAYGMLPG